MDTGDRSTENPDETEEDFGGALEQGVQEEPKNPDDPENVSSHLDRPRPKKGDYPAVGPNGPDDLNIE